MPAAMPSSQPTLESGYSDAPNGTSMASTAKLIVTMANVVMGRARSVIPLVLCPVGERTIAGSGEAHALSDLTSSPQSRKMRGWIRQSASIEMGSGGASRQLVHSIWRTRRPSSRRSRVSAPDSTVVLPSTLI